MRVLSADDHPLLREGIDAMLAIRSEFPDARIVMLTTFEADVEIHRALAGGTRRYVLKSMPPAELVDVIRHVHAAHVAEHLSNESLTSREVEVLRHVAAGNRNRDIADLLFISEETVKVHVKRGWRNSEPEIEPRPSPSPCAAALSSFDRITYPKVVGEISGSEGFARLSPAAPWKQSPD